MAQPGGRNLTFVALGISLLALVLAGYAVVRPQPTVQAGPPSASPSSTSATPTTSPVSSSDTGTPAATDTDTAGGSGGASPALPTVGYTVSYQDKKLRLTPNGTGCSERLVDLDQPAVTAQSTISDVTYTSCGGAPTLRFPNQSVAQVSSSTATAQDCANGITSSPSSQQVTLSRQLVLCTVTDGTSTPDQPARQRIARIVVDNVAQDGTTDITVTAWEIPH